MFREIEKIARENDCEIIYFTCLQENTRAQNLPVASHTDEKEKAFVKYSWIEKRHRTFSFPISPQHCLLFEIT